MTQILSEFLPLPLHVNAGFFDPGEIGDNTLKPTSKRLAEITGRVRIFVHAVCFALVVFTCTEQYFASYPYAIILVAPGFLWSVLRYVFLFGFDSGGLHVFRQYERVRQTSLVGQQLAFWVYPLLAFILCHLQHALQLPYAYNIVTHWACVISVMDVMADAGTL